MTYNFDPDHWYENELAVIKKQHMNPLDYEQDVADLDRRYDEMLERLDGSYQIPGTDK